MVSVDLRADYLAGFLKLPDTCRGDLCARFSKTSDDHVTPAFANCRWIAAGSVLGDSLSRLVALANTWRPGEAAAETGCWTSRWSAVTVDDTVVDVTWTPSLDDDVIITGDNVVASRTICVLRFADVD